MPYRVEAEFPDDTSEAKEPMLRFERLRDRNMSHLRFVGRSSERIAMVANSVLPKVLPRVAAYFVKPTIRRSPQSRRPLDRVVHARKPLGETPRTRHRVAIG